MLSFAPQTPIFTGTWDHRPVVSSPLSSSPIRASSPLSPVSNNALPQRLVQSSPIQPLKFKYASRPTRPNPVVRRREQVQEDRRRNFFQSVKLKSEERAWQRRDVEGQALKNGWLAHVAHFSQGASDLSDADIEDAIAFSQEAQQQQRQQQQQQQYPSSNDDDMMMMDDIPEEDEADEDRMEDQELEAMIASYEEQLQNPQLTHPEDLLGMSDEEQYDDVFAELISQEQRGEVDPICMDHDVMY